ncbi:MAG: S1C family serine protease [candidate division Zixibacteria bacterium]|nr:S1C family serine protease [candidate division Zixibacteria bacterium]
MKTLLVFSLAVFLSPATRAADSSLYSLENSISDLVYGLSRSVVTIESLNHSTAAGPGSPVHRVISSGIVLDSVGHILVSAKSVLGYDRVLVSADNRMVAVDVVAIDHQNDLALLQSPLWSGRPVELATSQACAGRMAIAMGNAFGMRSAPALGFCAGIRDDGVMQFSMPVPSGSIGGGIFDLSGHMLGIITGGMGEDNRMALAVPSYRIREIVTYLLSHGDRQSGFMGLTTREFEVFPGIRISGDHMFASVGAASDVTIERGVIVTSTVPGSPAHRAGLQVGDLIFAIDDVPVNSAAGVASFVRQLPPGRNVNVDLIRENQHLSLPLKVGQKVPDTPTRLSEAMPAAQQTAVVDSLKGILNVLKTEITRLEQRISDLE